MESAMHKDSDYTSFPDEIVYRSIREQQQLQQQQNESSSLSSPLFRSLGEHKSAQLTTIDAYLTDADTKASSDLSWGSTDATVLRSGKSSLLYGSSDDGGSTGPKSAPLQLAPLYLERFSSFISHMTSAELLRVVGGAFDASPYRVDFETKAAKNKLKGLVYIGAETISFQVQLYATEDNEVLVEFQRRSGCCVSFNTFYHKCLQQLGPKVVYREFIPKAVTSPLQQQQQQQQQQQAETLIVGRGDVVLDDNAVAALCAMASSGNVDTARQALSALAAFSDGHSQAGKLNQTKLLSINDDLSPPSLTTSSSIVSQSSSSSSSSTASQTDNSNSSVVTLLSKMLASGDTELARSSAVVMSNIASNARVHPNLLRLVDSMARLLDESDSLRSRETRRHIARTLANVSQTCGADLSQHTNLVESLKKFQNCGDQTMRSLVNTAIDHISV